jgi:hypothetical protein
MSIPSLLWACPACGTDRGLEASRGGAMCRACGTRFRRDRGASLRAVHVDGRTETRSAADWLDLLPEPRTVIREAGQGQPVRSSRVLISEVTGEVAVRADGAYLNRIERWGEPWPGRLEMWHDRLVVARDAGLRSAWPLDTLTAVQTSSKDLQLNRQDGPLTSFRFTDDSSYFWERLLHALLRDFYGRTGRGEIAEFQPRIATR